jgi:hypothetical protein
MGSAVIDATMRSVAIVLLEISADIFSGLGLRCTGSDCLFFICR